MKEARRQLTILLKQGTKNVFFTDHAELRMAQRGVTRQAVINCLRDGRFVPPPQQYQRSLRFKVRKLELVVMFAFDGPLRAAVVTVWKEEP